MRTKRVKAASEVAADLFAFEQALDHAIILGSRLAGTLPAARLTAGLAAEIGQEALESVMSAITSATQARRAIVTGHTHLSTALQQIGLKALAFSDIPKIPRIAHDAGAGRALPMLPA